MRLSDKENAYQIQNKLSAIYHSKIVNLLDHVCTSIIGIDQHMQVDRMEIDLGTLPLGDLEEEFTERVRRIFFEDLQQLLNQKKVDTQSTKETEKTVGNNQWFPISLHYQSEDRLISQKAFVMNLFKHFLRTGTFPWWTEKLHIGDLEKAIIDLYQKNSREIQIFLKKELINENARQRLIYQFSDTVLFKTVEVLLPDNLEQVQSLIIDLCKIHKKICLLSVSVTDFRYFIWDAIITYLLRQHIQVLSEKELIVFFFQSISRSHNVPYHKVVLMLRDAVDQLLRSQFTFNSKLPESIAIIQKEWLHKEKTRGLGTVADMKRGIPSERTVTELPLEKRDSTMNRPHDNVEKGEDAEQEQKVSDSLASQSTRETNQFDNEVAKKKEDWSHLTEFSKGAKPDKIFSDSLIVKHQSETTQVEEELATQEIYIENAGLVLLWPYYGTFFKNVKLLEGGKFIDETSAMRAIHLLQYLVTGEEEAPEYFLTLNKLLCDWDITKPVIKGMELSEFEKSESEELLQTVISHWSALKNTSMKGFQTSFLQRDGALTKNENNWLLRVERKTYDMLLDRLPWGISMVKLSWMKTLLNVEW